MFGKRIPLARMAGVEVRSDPSWILLLILVVWSLALGFFPQNFSHLSRATWWVMGLLGALGLVVSILLHELSHSLIARYFGMPIQGITLFLFGGMAEAKAEPDRPRTEFLVAAIGPAVSLLLGGLFYSFASLPWPDSVTGVLGYLGALNLGLAVFNLLPAFPLDGGRVLRAALWAWKRNLTEATRLASGGGSFFGLVLIVVGVLSAFRGNFLTGMWFVLIGLFLRSAALLSYQQVLVQNSLQGETVRRFMNPHPVTVSPSLTLQEFVNDYLLAHQHKVFPVVETGKFVGCAKMRDLQQVPKPEWGYRRVADILTSCPTAQVIRPDMDARQALTLMQQSGHQCLFVVEGGELIGVVGLKDMLKRLAFKMELENEAMAA